MDSSSLLHSSSTWPRRNTVSAIIPIVKQALMAFVVACFDAAYYKGHQSHDFLGVGW